MVVGLLVVEAGIDGDVGLPSRPHRHINSWKELSKATLRILLLSLQATTARLGHTGGIRTKQKAGR